MISMNILPVVDTTQMQGKMFVKGLSFYCMIKKLFVIVFFMFKPIFHCDAKLLALGLRVG